MATGHHIGMTWHQRLERRRKALGWSKAELSRRSDLPYDSINKYLRGEVDQPRGDALERLAEAMGLRPAWLRDGDGAQLSRIPVVGVISAGEAWLPIDDHPKGGGLDEISFDLDDADPIAIRVRGTSMAPVYRDGDILICSRLRGMDISQCLSHDCAVMTRDGHGYLKILLKGSGADRFRLRSYNPAYPDAEDVRIEWAAPVVWIKRAH